MNRRVVVTGLGTVSPVGNTVDEAWLALLDGRSGAAPITKFDASNLKVRFGSGKPAFSPDWSTAC